MKRVTLLLVAVATLAGAIAFTAHASRLADPEATPTFVTKIPSGYRDWRLISVAREEGTLNDIRAILGNDKAIKAYREGKLPFPEGSIIARLAWSTTPQRKTTKPLAGHNRSWPVSPRTAFNSWSRTQKNTRRRAAGGTVISTTANLPTRRCSTRAFPATRLSKLMTLSSHVIHIDTYLFSG
jgi:Cytochrome P460